MAELLSQVFFPSGFQELFSTWNRFPDAILYAGGTGLIRDQGRRVPVFPHSIMCLNKLDELKKISRTERYLEIGAMVKLNQILRLGKIVPEAFVRCLEAIAGPQIRNLATIGGNLCNSSERLDCSCPLTALDAQFELRTAQSARWIAASQFYASPGPPELSSQEILTRIRVPLDPWTFTSYRKFRTSGSNAAGESILFMMKNQKDILTNIRVVYSGNGLLREKTSENLLVGKRLPLDKKDAAALTESWRTYLSSIEDSDDLFLPEKDGINHSEFIKTQILNFIESTIMHITD